MKDMDVGGLGVSLCMLKMGKSFKEVHWDSRTPLMHRVCTERCSYPKGGTGGYDEFP